MRGKIRPAGQAEAGTPRSFVDLETLLLFGRTAGSLLFRFLRNRRITFGCPITVDLPSVTGRELDSEAVATRPQARHFRYSTLLLSNNDMTNPPQYTN